MPASRRHPQAGRLCSPDRNGSCENAGRGARMLLMKTSSPMEDAARRTVDRLRASGHIAYFAGGCVRDILRGQTPKDFDIATDATPETVQKIFARTYAVGAHFGVIVVLEDGSQSAVAT